MPYIETKITGKKMHSHSDHEFCCDVKKKAVELEVANIIKLNTGFSSLETKFELSSEGIHAIIEALKFNNTIEKFDCTYNFIEADDAHALAKLLESNTSITQLQLRALSPTAAKIIAASLVNNTNITSIVIRGNSDSESAAPFADLLKKNNVIEQFVHWGADLSLETAHKFATSLRHNHTLYYFEIFANVDDRVMAEFTDALEVNTSINIFNAAPHAHYYDNLHEAYSQINKYLERNRNLYNNLPFTRFAELIHKHFAIFHNGPSNTPFTLEFLNYFKKIPETAEFKDYITLLEHNPEATISSPQGKQELSAASNPSEAPRNSSESSIGASLNNHGLFKRKTIFQEVARLKKIKVEPLDSKEKNRP